MVLTYKGKNFKMADKHTLLNLLDQHPATKSRSRKFQFTISLVAGCIILFAIISILYRLIFQ
jgi:hypothetical protein